MEQLSQTYKTILARAQAAPADIVLLLGQTGGGKSSIANAILGGAACQEGHTLNSETKVCQVEQTRWAGSNCPVTIIDTPGFLDSERRDAQFLADITEFLRYFPKDKLRVVIITIPLSGNRINSTYKDMLDIIELMLGEEVWQHAVFVTTLQNQMKDLSTARSREEEWLNWLRNVIKLPVVNHCNFVYGDSASLNPVRALFKAFKPFTPETSKKIDAYIKSNPGATVNEMIENVEATNKLKAKFEEDMAKLLEEKKETIARLDNQAQLTTRLQKELDQAKKDKVDLDKRITELQNMPRVTEVHHHHTHRSGGCILS